MDVQAAQTQRKLRGKNKAPKWKKPEDGRVSVMVLPLAVTDPADLAQLEKLFGAMWSIKRAVQRDARAKIDAYVDDPKSAYLDTTASRHAQITFTQGLEEALRESTAPSQTTVRGAGHAAVPRQRRGTSAPRTAGRRSRATPDEPRHVRDHAGKPGHRPGRNPQLTLW
ncbi:hypothetical protein [Streptomyces sp. NBC_00091]|uniref:hypothetical protein n=1 Tax=Streptomyces sp. NBC_00091 TaxID=2975648 RepID=UPI002252958E|nr:hypothetical protein [Streptomyces sp. NBC_00091]MCX5378784.1 hypothetical protein [Streptomyces sp. NBC_00091]